MATDFIATSYQKVHEVAQEIGCPSPSSTQFSKHKHTPKSVIKLKMSSRLLAEVTEAKVLLQNNYMVGS